MPATPIIEKHCEEMQFSQCCGHVEIVRNNSFGAFRCCGCRKLKKNKCRVSLIGSLISKHSKSSNRIVFIPEAEYKSKCFITDDTEYNVFFCYISHDKVILGAHNIDRDIRNREALPELVLQLDNNTKCFGAQAREAHSCYNKTGQINQDATFLAIFVIQHLDNNTKC